MPFLWAILVFLFVCFQVGSGDIGLGFERIVVSAILIAIAWAVVANRRKIVSWYYFVFYPHPAEPMIRQALEYNSAFDAEALAFALGEAPADSQILREVRVEQAQSLIKEMKAATAAQVKALNARAKTEQERAAALGAQEAVAHAAIALERAKAALAASRASGGSF